jgi:asparagine synthase (glutamine-hydrolysing)
MSALEVAAGMPFGWDPPVPARPEADDPMSALEEVLVAALQDPPCRIAFSGGRDSSLLLAAATRAARRHGLPLPIPVTGRYADAASQEHRWQELVLDHLSLDEHVVVDVADEHDAIGPLATAQLRRHGLLFPPNGHITASLFGDTRGGTLLLGIGGDELLARQRWSRLNDVLARRTRPGLLDPARLAVALSPGRVQKLFGSPGLPPAPWLRPSAVRGVRSLQRREPADPLRFDRAARKAARARVLTVAMKGLRAVGGPAGVSVEMPLLDDRFVAALANAGGPRGWTNRSTVMRFLASDLLPEELLSRPDKAEFTTAFLNEHTRRFAAEWSGGGVDTDLVDAEVLRQAWLSPKPDIRSTLLLQLAWLHDHARVGMGTTEASAPPGRTLA